MQVRISILPLAIIPAATLIGKILFDISSSATETGIIDALVSGGPVAILAFIIWWQARADSKNNRDQWQATCKELVDLKRDDIRSRDENTKALQKLTDIVDAVSHKGS
jgi:hypothetical protein